MLTARASGSATLLHDGRVLLVGGYPGEGEQPTSAAEVFDPKSSTFTAVAPLLTPRADHSATVLPSGRVLIAGGWSDSGGSLTSTEIFDPLTNQFQAGPPLTSARAAHAAVALGPDVVLIGGATGRQAVVTSDVYRGGTWRAGPNLRTPRVKLGAAAIDQRRILVVGGAEDTEGRGRLRTTEIVNLATGSALPGPSLSERQYKLEGAVATMGDGRIVIAGGTRIEVYDAASGRLSTLARPVLSRRSFRTATPVGTDAVLVTGGYDDAIVPTDAAQLIVLANH